MVKPQTVRYRLIKKTSKFWKYSRIWKISLDSILNCCIRYKCIVIQEDSWINIHEWFGCNFPTWNIHYVWRARDDGHHYDVTSKYCVVTITTRLVEWTLSISEIHVFFCCFQELSGCKKITNGYPNKVWDKSKTTQAVDIAQLTHHSVRYGDYTIFTCDVIMVPVVTRAFRYRIWCNKHLRHTTTGKYDSNGKSGYFRFDDDDNMSYRYILSFT